MTNEEAVKIIESLGPDDSEYGWRKVADAFNLAIKALTDKPKYEMALFMAVSDSSDHGTDVWCKDCPYEKIIPQHCCECGVRYYKHNVGLDDDK